MTSLKERIGAATEGYKIKKEGEAASSPLMVDVSEEKALKAIPPSEKQLIMQIAMGITSAQAEFFSTGAKFVDSRTGEVEKEKTTILRNEVWTWMERSLMKGVSMDCRFY